MATWRKQEVAAASSFASDLKQHLIGWAARQAPPLPTDGKHGWVLPLSEYDRNFFDRSWGSFIAGKRHRWSHALNSSQAFAVNLFGPAKASPDAAKALWSELVDPVGTERPDRCEVNFEFNGPDTDDFCARTLGERGQPTQIDVALCAHFGRARPRYLLIEVKLAEVKFGSCRGRQNEACGSLPAVLEDVKNNCWLTRTEGRTYWAVISGTPYPLDLSAALHEGCPWRGGLYQIMRNWAFGQALVAGNFGADFRVGLCVHPANQGVFELQEPVAKKVNAFESFNRLVAQRPILRIDARMVIDALDPLAPMGWAAYMRDRYRL